MTTFSITQVDKWVESTSYRTIIWQFLDSWRVRGALGTFWGPSVGIISAPKSAIQRFAPVESCIERDVTARLPPS